MNTRNLAVAVATAIVAIVLGGIWAYPKLTGREDKVKKIIASGFVVYRDQMHKVLFVDNNGTAVVVGSSGVQFKVDMGDLSPVDPKTVSDMVKAAKSDKQPPPDGQGDRQQPPPPPPPSPQVNQPQQAPR